MAHATGSRRRIVYGAETGGFKETPLTGKILRNTADSLNLSKSAIASAELSGDRAVRFLRHGNKTIGGDISFELAYGAYDELLAAALGSTWAGNTLKQGLVIPTFSIEKGFQDIGKYTVYKGCAIDTLTIDLATDSIVTGSFGIIGADTTGYTNAPFDNSPTPVSGNDNEPFTSFEGSIKLDDTSTCIITALSFTIENGITANYALCGPDARSLTPDRVNITGTVTALFEDEVELNKFINETITSIEAELEDPDGNKLSFKFPRVKYTGGEAPVSDGGVISLSLPFQALYDDTNGVKSAIVITRTAA